MNMTEEKRIKLNEIAEMIPEVSKAKTNAYTSYINARACLDIDKLNLNIIDDFSEFIYRNISDVCTFSFLFELTEEPADVKMK